MISGEVILAEITYDIKKVKLSASQDLLQFITVLRPIFIF
jgi:hypothetical protein